MSLEAINCKEQLIDDVAMWLKFLESRNMSTYVYSETQANAVYEQAKLFPPYVEKLIYEVEKRK